MSDYKLTLQSHNSDLQELINMANELPDKVEGVQLNFDVVGGIEEPTNPIENTIWVQTDAAIADWVFSVKEPEIPAEGMVWITTGASSTVEFNILKKNNIQVYPISAKQYVDGTWVDRDAVSYQGGEWAMWIAYLYKLGDEYKAFTDGWALSLNNGGNTHGESLSKKSDSMVFASSYVSGSHFADGFLRANNTFDLTGVTQITAILKTASVSSNVPMFLCVAENDSYRQQYDAVAKANISSGNTSVTLDVSALKGVYYVGIGAGAGSANGSSSVTIAEIYFE